MSEEVKRVSPKPVWFAGREKEEILKSVCVPNPIQFSISDAAVPKRSVLHFSVVGGVREASSR